VTSDIGRAPVARVVAGVQALLHRKGYMLALGAFDCASEWNTISVQLQQRGIEGVISIDAILPQDLSLPVASVDLEYMSFLEPLSEEMQVWLSELGESAAETVLRQIEKDSVPRRMKVAPKLPNAHFELSNESLGVEVDTRERA
jgi:DNA-binding LacI/PurR family transcriptional regulator